MGLMNKRVWIFTTRLADDLSLARAHQATLLQHHTLALSALSLVDGEGSSRRMLKHLLDALARSSTAFQVLVGTDLLCYSHCLKLIYERERDASSVETGACRVFFNSSSVFASFLKSHFSPTRMTGSPAQKWSTSLIH
jgi:hypothetical protein